MKKFNWQLFVTDAKETVFVILIMVFGTLFYFTGGGIIICALLIYDGYPILAGLSLVPLTILGISRVGQKMKKYFN